MVVKHKLLLKTHIVMGKCESVVVKSSQGLKAQEVLLILCGQYIEIVQNDTTIQDFIPKLSNVFKEIFRLDTDIFHREKMQLLNIHSELIGMPIGFAKIHLPSYQVHINELLIELPYEVITFSAYKRLQELGYDLFDYEPFPLLRFLSLEDHVYFGADEINQISIFTEKFN